MTDDDTPPIRLVTDEDATSKRHRLLESDPHVYLPQEPPEAARRLMVALDRHNGSYVPYAHFATLAIIVQHLAGWIGRADGFWRRTRRYLTAAVGAAAVNLSALGLYMLHRHDEAVAAIERAKADADIDAIRRAGTDATLERLQKTIDQLREQHQKEIDQLRERLLRLSGAQPPRHPDSAIFVMPDKVSVTSPRKGPP